MMADDKEVLREVWEGRLPVCFNISSTEVVTIEQPEPCYYLVPRGSYFPLVMDKVFVHFQKASNQDSSADMWLENNGVALRWHYPIGVLYDMYGNNQLPWNLTVHFRNFPETEILRCGSRDAMEAHFMSMLKEADCLKHRSVVMNAMKKNDHKQLWMGLCNNKFEQFWAVNKRLMERVNSEPFRAIPVKMYLSDGTLLQRLFKAVSNTGELHTFGHFLKTCLSHVLDETKEGTLSDKWRVTLQGVTPPLEAPMQWVSEHLSYPDNFLHVVVSQR